MKKNYSKPVMKVAYIDQTMIICASQITGTGGTEGIGFGGAGDEPAHAPKHGGFDEWEEEEDWDS